jgi:putrescine transport system permease protein
LHTDFAVYLGIVYSYLPFMVLPLYASLSNMDRNLLEAAADLGCKPWKAFLSVTLPLSLPGIIAGCMLVFIPAVGEFVIPDLLGGPDSLMIGKVLWTEFFSNRDWPAASAVAVVMLVLLVVPLALFQRAQEKSEGKTPYEQSPPLPAVHPAGIRLCVSLYTDHCPDRVFIQRLAAGHGVGWILHQMVRRTAAQ